MLEREAYFVLAKWLNPALQIADNMSAFDSRDRGPTYDHSHILPTRRGRHDR
jgi:hypothetical protein